MSFSPTVETSFSPVSREVLDDQPVVDSGLDRDQLTLIMQGHAASQMLHAGVAFGVFDLLSERPGLTPAQVGEALSLAPQPTRILLVGLTSLGLLVRDEGRLYNAPVTEETMVHGKEGCLADVVGWQIEIVYPGLVDFVDALKQNRNVGLRHFPGQGDTLYQRLRNDAHKEQVFQDSMSALSNHANTIFADNCDLSGCTHLVDIGGGDGTNAINIVRRFPHIKVTVFDGTSVLEIAKKNIQEAGLEERVSTWVGDVFEDDFPPGIDAILFGHFFTIWSPEKNREILAKCRRALPPGGQVILFNMMGNDAEDGPISTAMGSAYFLTIATGEGMLYSWKDYEDWMVDAGFAHTHRGGGLPLDHGLFIGRC